MFENHKNVFKIVIILRGVLKFKFCYWYTQRLKIMEVDLHLFDYLGLDILLAGLREIFIRPGIRGLDQNSGLHFLRTLNWAKKDLIYSCYNNKLKSMSVFVALLVVSLLVGFIVGFIDRKQSADRFKFRNLQFQIELKIFRLEQRNSF